MERGIERGDERTINFFGFPVDFWGTNQERCSRKVWYNQEKNITMRTGGMIYGQAQRSVD